MPRAVRQYIERNNTQKKDEYVLDNQKNFVISIESDAVKRMYDHEIKGITDVEFQFFVENLLNPRKAPSISAYYPDTLMGQIRLVRNLLVHPYDVDFKATLELCCYSMPTFVKHIIENHPNFASDVERLIFVTKQDFNKGFVAYRGNVSLALVGGGSLFKGADCRIRSSRVDVSYDDFKTHQEKSRRSST